MNDPANTAVLPTVKGCNPITGLQTSGYHLERYDNKCPKHGKEFKHDRFCEECGYKWPPQNYVAAPNTLWWDVWFNNGQGRQLFFTEDEVRDIATHMIGKENTVPAFGFAFYRPKVERPRSSETFFGGAIAVSSSAMPLYGHHMTDWGSHTLSGSFLTYNCANSAGLTPTAGGTLMSTLDDADDIKGITPTGEVKCLYAAAAPASGKSLKKSARGFSAMRRMKTVAESPLRLRAEDVTEDDGEYKSDERGDTPKKEVSVGAGAKIAQDLVEDPHPLDTWKDTPDSVMTIYFVFKDEVDRMLSKGIVETVEKPEGMLAGLPVG